MINLPTIFFDFDRPFAVLDSRLAAQRNALQSVLSPACEFHETEGHYVFSFDMPGIDKSAIRLELQDDELVVSGERKFEREETKGKRHFSERRYGKFQRTFALPAGVKTEDVDAKFENGVLTVSVAKPAKAQRSEIKVN